MRLVVVRVARFLRMRTLAALARARHARKRLLSTFGGLARAAARAEEEVKHDGALVLDDNAEHAW